MKPPKFHVGQAVVCLNDTEWQGLEETPDPKKGAIYHVLANKRWQGIITISLKEIGPDYGYDESGFAPAELLPDKALAQLLEETLEPVTA